ncbi:unnamed protein product, partial [Effrenium voratum]
EVPKLILPILETPSFPTPGAKWGSSQVEPVAALCESSVQEENSSKQRDCDSISDGTAQESSGDWGSWNNWGYDWGDRDWREQQENSGDWGNWDEWGYDWGDRSWRGKRKRQESSGSQRDWRDCGYSGYWNDGRNQQAARDDIESQMPADQKQVSEDSMNKAATAASAVEAASEPSPAPAPEPAPAALRSILKPGYRAKNLLRVSFEKELVRKVAEVPRAPRTDWYQHIKKSLVACARCGEWWEERKSYVAENYRGQRDLVCVHCKSDWPRHLVSSLPGRGCVGSLQLTEPLPPAPVSPEIGETSSPEIGSPEILSSESEGEDSMSDVSTDNSSDLEAEIRTQELKRQLEKVDESGKQFPQKTRKAVPAVPTAPFANSGETCPVCKG